MRRGCFLQPGVPLPAALRTARPGRMIAADYSAPFASPGGAPGVQSLHPFAGLLPSPGGDARFRVRRARVPFDQPLPAPAVFAGRPARPRRCIFMPRPTSPNRGWVIRGFRALTPVEDPIDSIFRDRSILPWALSSCRVADAPHASGRGTHLVPLTPWAHSRPVVWLPRVIRQSPARSSRAYPLLGLRRPSCADVTGISSGCIHLHGAVSAGSGVAGPSAFCEADASPIQQV
jgi:hypothetical protein